MKLIAMTDSYQPLVDDGFINGWGVIWDHVAKLFNTPLMYNLSNIICSFDTNHLLFPSLRAQ